MWWKVEIWLILNPAYGDYNLAHGDVVDLQSGTLRCGGPTILHVEI